MFLDSAKARYSNISDTYKLRLFNILQNSCCTVKCVTLDIILRS